MARYKKEMSEIKATLKTVKNGCYIFRRIFLEENERQLGSLDVTNEPALELALRLAPFAAEMKEMLIGWVHGADMMIDTCSLLDRIKDSEVAK